MVARRLPITKSKGVPLSTAKLFRQSVVLYREQLGKFDVVLSVAEAATGVPNPTGLTSLDVTVDTAVEVLLIGSVMRFERYSFRFLLEFVF